MSEHKINLDLFDEVDDDLDINAIFGGGTQSVEIPAAPIDVLPPAVQEDPTVSATPSAETIPVKQEPKSSAPAGDPEPDLFSAFASGNMQEPPTPQPKAASKSTSLFDKPPVFSYGGAKENINDASQTFEELRIKKADDFPELEEGKSVSWKVRYGDVTKSIPNPKDTTIAKIKEEIEKSKAFLDSLKKAKNKNPDCLIIPSVTAKSKGIASYKGVFPSVDMARASDKVICLIPAKDGQVYEMRKSELGEFVAPKHNIVDFQEVKAGFTPALPLIPRQMIGQIISFFRFQMQGAQEYEALAYIYWDKENEEFVPFIPKQKVSKAYIDAGRPDNRLPEDRYLHYADIHSHNSMSAKFSSIDDRDEKATRLYLVIGNLDRFYPSVTARISCGGTYQEIDPELVLEGLGEEFPTQWLEQVEKVDTEPRRKGRWMDALLSDLPRGMVL